LSERRLACAQLAGESQEKGWIDRLPEILSPHSQLRLSELEVPSLGERRNEVPVRWHC
jgi:hypothetical protein